MTSQPSFELALLGPLCLTGPNGPLLFSNKKVACLLSYLAVRAPRMQQRERLAELLWGSSFDVQAKQNLRQSLFRLRKLLGAEAIIGEGNDVGLASNLVRSDVKRFESLIAEGSHQALAVAVDLYRGPLLDGFSVPEEAWIAWLSHERDRLQDLAVGALVALGKMERASGRGDLALKAGQRAVALNALREDAHRLVIVELAAAGRKAEALKHYHDLVSVLRRELDAEPDAETRELVADLRIRAGDLHVGVNGREHGNEGTPSSKANASTMAGMGGSLAQTDANRWGASVQRPLPIPQNLSLIVLPFTNLGSDNRYAYLADAMTEVVTADLSRISALTVVATTTAKTFDAGTADIKQICRDAGVRYTLKGSLQQSGPVLRITAQLIDGSSGATLWSDRFDGDVADPFSLQDRITGRIAVSIGRKIETIAAADSTRGRSIPGATDMLLRGLAARHRLYGRENLKHQEECFREAMRLDPTNSDAHALFARVVALQLFSHFLAHGDDPASLQAKALAAAARSVALNPNNANAHVAVGLLNILQGDFAQAAIDNEIAIGLDRNSWPAHNNLGIALTHAGQAERAIPAIERAMRLDPLGPQIAINYVGMGFARLQLGQIDAARLSFQKARAANRALPRAYMGLAVTYVLKDDLVEARRVAAELAQAVPAYRLSKSIDRVFPSSPEPYRKFYETILSPAATQAGVPR